MAYVHDQLTPRDLTQASDFMKAMPEADGELLPSFPLAMTHSPRKKPGCSLCSHLQGCHLQLLLCVSCILHGLQVAA